VAGGELWKAAPDGLNAINVKEPVMHTVYWTANV